MPRTLVIGVAGGTGSGKTTVTREIVRQVGAERIAVITQDHYYRDLSHLELAQRAQQNFDHPDSIEEELLVEHVTSLREGRPVRIPLYDFSRHLRLTETEPVAAHRVVLVEGILVLALPTVRRLLDVKIFVDTDADLRFIRRLQRDVSERGRSVDGVVKQYMDTVRPMHLEFVEPSKRWADVIIPEGGYNNVALEMVVSRIEQMLSSVVTGATPAPHSVD